jgi:hypothetical protein
MVVVVIGAGNIVQIVYQVACASGNLGASVQAGGGSGIRGGAVRHINATSSRVKP